jgi:hypothetical protein
MSERELIDIAAHLQPITSDDWKRLERSPQRQTAAATRSRNPAFAFQS